MTKTEYISKLGTDIAHLKDRLYTQESAWAAKIRAVTAFGEIVERVAEAQGKNKDWMAARLRLIAPIFDTVDKLTSEVGELEMVNEHLIGLKNQLLMRVKEDEALIDKLLNEKM